IIELKSLDTKSSCKYQYTFCSLSHHDHEMIIKPIKQIVQIGGNFFELDEIFISGTESEDQQDAGLCVVCMVEPSNVVSIATDDQKWYSIFFPYLTRTIVIINLFVSIVQKY